MSDELELAEAELELAKAKARKTAPDGVVAGSPLDRARATQSGDMLTIQTPTGPWTGTREGVPILQGDEMFQGADERVRLGMLQAGLSTLSGGAHGLEKQAYGIQKAGEYLPTALKNAVTGTPGESVVERYRRMRDDAGRTVDEATRKASPTVAGVPVLPLIGGMATMGPAAETIPMGMAAAGYTGALQGVADSPGDLTKGDFGQVAGDALKSGARDAATAGVISKGLQSAGGAAASGLEKMSRANAGKSLGLYAGISNLGKRLGYESADELGDFFAKVRDEGDIIKPFGTPDDVANRVEARLPELGKKQAAILEATDVVAANKRNPISNRALPEVAGAAPTAAPDHFDFAGAADSMEDAIRPKFGGNPISDAASKPALKHIEATRNTTPGAEIGPLPEGEVLPSFRRANELKQHLYSDIPWNAPNFGQGTDLGVGMQRGAYDALRSKLLSEVERVSGPKAAEMLSGTNREIALLKDVQHLSTNESMRAMGRKNPTLGALATGGTGLAASGLGTAMGLSPVAASSLGLAAAGVQSMVAPRLPSALTYAQKAAGQAAGNITGQLPSRAAATALDQLGSPAGETDEVSPAKQQANATQQLEQYLGRPVKDKQEAADQHFLLGTSDPRYQKKNEEN